MINVMAKKEATKKPTKKAAKKLEEQAPIEVQEFEEAAALEVGEEPEDMGPAEIEVMNGDPAVVTPVEEPAPPMAVDEPESDDEELPEEWGESDAAEPEEEAPAPKEQIKPKKSVFKRMFGYIWNGQEMDY